MSMPAWQTGELDEEWVESSPSPPPNLSALPAAFPSLQPTVDSVRAKRGSLRALGHAAARGLPLSRNTSEQAERIVSGHGAGRGLSNNLSVGEVTELVSPPNSRSSSGAAVEEQAAAIGTFVVKEGVEDDRGRMLAKIGGKGRDMFGPSALEKMFRPPSPPAPTALVSTTPTAVPLVDELRRATHPYAPAQPSRLSKSVTPSSDASISMSVPPSENSIAELPQHPDEEGAALPLSAVEHDSLHDLTRQGAEFAFTFHAGRAAESVSGTGTGSGTTTIKAGSHRSAFAPSFGPTDDGEPSHSTLHGQNRRHRGKGLSPSSPVPSNPALRLFRSTYDTYTREHLSALVDSIAIEPSPSPPNLNAAQDIREWSPEASPDYHSQSGSQSGSGGGSAEGESSDARSTKRMRMSPASPPRREALLRDWGQQGMDMMARIRGRVEDSTTSASRSDGQLIGEEPTIDYNNLEPTPPLSASPFPDSPLNRRTHRSNPSTTSSGYLRAAEDLMAKIKARVVSESASASGADSGGRPPLSEKDEQSVGLAAEWDAIEDEYQKTKGKGKAAPSPRRMLRRLSAAEEVRRVADDESTDDQLAVPAIPTMGSLRQRRLQEERRPISRSSNGSAPLPPPAQAPNSDDLARFVSSATTIRSATTISTSFVKHAGPRARSSGSKGMRVIGPSDVNAVVGDQVGKMRYDKSAMRWVKERDAGLGKVDEAEESRAGGSEESVDVFAGMESWGEAVVQASSPRAEAALSVSDGEEGDLKGDSTYIGEVSATSDSGSAASDHNDLLLKPINPPYVPSLPIRPIPQHAISAPAVMTPGANIAPLPIRSALRRPQGLTPGIKKRAGWHDSVTPAPESGPGGINSSEKRSVSFSDGKKSGKIVGLDHGRDVFAQKGQAPIGEKSWLPSARTQRIGDVLEEMEELSLDAETPSKPPRMEVSIRQPSLTSTSPDHDDTEVEGDSTVRADDLTRRRSRADMANATFLTECSFGVAHDKLVQLITDVYGSEPWWEKLTSLNLRGKGVESVARLKEFLPDLDEINLNENKISYLSGIPMTVRTLHVAANRLTSLTSVSHLRNLQYLDVSRNQLDSVSQLSCLKHLRELKADNNQIQNLDGLLDMDCLIRLSVEGNKLEVLDLSDAKWQKLESLNVANNRIASVDELHRLTGVSSLNFDGNRLTRLSPMRPMPLVRTLRVSENDLRAVDISLFPRLRTFYADGNFLFGLTRSDGTGGTKLESLSVRSQRVEGFALTPADLESVKRLYISGNPLTADFFPATALYNLSYLEAAACKLSTLPTSFAARLPNLKVLNVNYNFLEDLDALRGLRALRRLTVVGNRLGSGNKGAARGLKGLTTLEEVDLRMNPATLGFYLPLLLPSTPLAILDPSSPPPSRQKRSFPSLTASTIAPPSRDPATDQRDVWIRLDGQFRRSLPDEWYGKRLVYRGLVMRATEGRVGVLDGIRVTDGERKKAGELLVRAGAGM